MKHRVAVGSNPDDSCGNTKEELEAMLVKMSSASDSFYFQATQVGNHAFIEFAGLLNEYIQICRDTLAENTDFANASVHTGVGLKPKDYRIKYFAEKFECIFGGMFQDPEAQKAFKKYMGWEL